ncbi:MAG: glycosyltransferase family 2 protein [Acidobacteriota bacterium]
MRQDLISVVVPVLDEEHSLRALYRGICAALSTVEDITYEIIFVDDGSRDETWSVICSFREQDLRVKAARLSRNFGHQAALTAGYHYASGHCVISMDGDLQHPPELLPLMIQRWRQGYAVVSMVRDEAETESWPKVLCSRLFYRFINALSEVKIKPAVADFRLLDRRVVRRLNSLTERGRFVRGLISWVGFEETEIHYTPAPRFAGRTKYSWRKMVGLAVNAVSSFSSAPLKWGFNIGLAVTALCVALMSYAVYNKVYEHKDLTEWSSTFLTMLFLSGVQLLMIGVIGVYVGRIFDEVKKRPAYITEERLGLVPRSRLRASAAAARRSA